MQFKHEKLKLLPRKKSLISFFSLLVLATELWRRGSVTYINAHLIDRAQGLIGIDRALGVALLDLFRLSSDR